MPANTHHYTKVLTVFFLSLGLVLSIFSLSSSNLASPNRAFAADDCYDSEGNYICEDMSDGSSNSDSASGDSSGDSGSGDSGGDSGSGDSGGDSGSGDSGGDSGSGDSGGDSGSGDSGGDSGSGDSGGDSGSGDSVPHVTMKKVDIFVHNQMKALQIIWVMVNRQVMSRLRMIPMEIIHRQRTIHLRIKNRYLTMVMALIVYNHPCLQYATMTLAATILVQTAAIVMKVHQLPMLDQTAKYQKASP